MSSTANERGPLYGVNLIKSLPLPGGMTQAMPSRRDLEQVAKINQRVSAGYEVAIAHLAMHAASNAELLEACKSLISQVEIAVDFFIDDPGENSHVDAAAQAIELGKAAIAKAEAAHAESGGGS